MGIVDDITRLVETDEVEDVARALAASPIRVRHDPRFAHAVAQVVDVAEPRLAATLYVGAAEAFEASAAWHEAVDAWQRGIVASGRAVDAEAVGVLTVRATAAAASIADAVDRLAAGANLAAHLSWAGHPRAAAIAAERAVADADHLDTRDRAVARILAAALVNLAAARLDSDDAEVEDVLRRAEDIYRSLDEPLHLGNVAVNRGRACSLRGDVDGERAAHDAAMRSFEQAGASPTDRGYAARGFGASLAQVGRYEEALEWYDVAHALFEEDDDWLEAQRTVTAVLMARDSAGDIPSADELAEYEATLARLPPQDAADRARNLANLRANAGELDRALPLYAEAIAKLTSSGRTGTAAEVRSTRATVLRRVGELDGAQRELELAIAALEAHERWIPLSGGHHNLAVVLRDRAAQENDPELVDVALGHSLRAIGIFDRHRHALPSPADRRAFLDRARRQIFPMAIDLAAAAQDADLLAALFERVRVQPVLDDATTATRRRFLHPAPVRARRGARAVPGGGTPVTLTALAGRLVGRRGEWLSWHRAAHGTLVSRVTPAATHVSACADPEPALQTYALATAIPTDAERAPAGDDVALAARLARYRAALGPMCRDLDLARLLRDTFRARLARLVEDQLPEGWTTTTDAELLWPLAESLLPDHLLTELRTIKHAKARLAIAPTTGVGRVPWPALPIAPPDVADGPRRLVEAADLVLAVPASLATRAHAVDHDRRGHIAVIDPLGDLRASRHTPLPDGVRVLGHGSAAATREAVAARLADRPRQLTLLTHVLPGSASDPGTASVVLDAGSGEPDRVDVLQLASWSVPPVCVVLGCDGAGMATGDEWTGPATGLLWGGACWVVSSSVPTLEDRAQAITDGEILGAIDRHGPLDGLWRWQRASAERLRRDPSDATAQPYRWGTVVAASTSPRSAARNG